MKKKIIILTSMILLIGLIVYMCYPKSNISKQSNDNIETNNTSKVEENKENENNKKITSDDSNNNENNSSSIHNSNQNDMESNNASNNNVVKPKENKTTKKVEEKHEEPKTTEVKTTTTVELKKEEIGPWTAWGMTKEQYYNEPMYKWEHVDFSVKKYGSESAARQACLNYGDNYQPYINGEVLYNCSTVNSASGNYLGEMFSTEKLN